MSQDNLTDNVDSWGIDLDLQADIRYFFAEYHH